MNKISAALLISLILIASPLAAQAPPIDVLVSGIELCPQFICNYAVFAGTFHGRVGFNTNATGIVSTAVQHGELPTVEGGTTPIYSGGVWELKTLFRRISGVVTGGIIEYEGNNEFRVTIELTVLNGGSGNLTFNGFLDHNPTIPEFGGTLK